MSKAAHTFSTRIRGFISAGTLLVSVLGALGPASASADSTVATVVPYQASAYKYQVVNSGALAGFESPTFDDSGFSTGTAAFGTGGYCPLDNTVATYWAPNTDILVRRTVDLPAGTSGVVIRIAVDNDATVYWNGQAMGSTIHENCAQKDTLVVTLPDVALLAGSNQLAVRGHDRGGETFLDLTVTAALLGSKPSRQVEFVHGIGGNFTNEQLGIEYQGVLNPIRARYPLEILAYYQDIGYQQSPGGCGSQPAAVTVTEGLYAPPGDVDNSVCDSQSAIAYDATALDATLSRGPGPIAVVANSMGGAITRGWLTLAQERRKRGVIDPSLDNVDTVIFIQGVQQGSYVAGINQDLIYLDVIFALMTGSPLGVVDLAKQLAAQAGVPLDPLRPAARDLVPQSDWFQTVNSTAPPANIHYFNFYSDIRVEDKLYFGRRTLTVGNFELGDTVVLPGTPNPNELPASGGARFLPGGNAPDRREFEYAVTYPFADSYLGTHPVDAAKIVLADPGTHMNFGSNFDDPRVNVSSCRTGVPDVTPKEQLMHILEDPARACTT